MALLLPGRDFYQLKAFQMHLARQNVFIQETSKKGFLEISIDRERSFTDRYICTV